MGNIMSYGTLVSVIAEKTKLQKKQVKEVMDAFREEVRTKTLEHGVAINLPQLFTIALKRYKPRNTMASGKLHQTPARKRLVMRAHRAANKREEPEAPPTPNPDEVAVTE